MSFLSGITDTLFGGGGSSSQTRPDQVYGVQSPFLQGLYARAYNASLGQGSGGFGMGGGTGPGTGPTQGGQPMRRGGFLDYINQANQGGRATTQPVPGGANGGQSFADPLAAFGGQLANTGAGILGNLAGLSQTGNPFVQAQIGQLGSGLGRLFQQQIMPGIASTFNQANQLGGDRQALALGQASEGLGQAFTSGALDLLGNSTNSAINAGSVGLQNLGNVFGAGNAAVFGSLPGLAGLLGPPTVLGQGGSASMNQSNGVFGSIGFNPLKLFGGPGCPACALPPMPCACSCTPWPTISPTSCAPSRRRRQSPLGH